MADDNATQPEQDQARELAREQLTPTQTPEVKQEKKLSRGDQVRKVLEAARDEFAKSDDKGDKEKASALTSLLGSEKFNEVLKNDYFKQDAQREQAAPAGDMSKDPNKGEMEFDSTSAEVEVEKALQAAAEAGVPSDQITQARAAISAYQSRKSEATKGAAEAAVASAKPQMQVANDEAAKKFQQEAMGTFTKLAGVVGFAEAVKGFAGCCRDMQDVNVPPHQVGVQALVGAITKDLSKGAGVGVGNMG